MAGRDPGRRGLGGLGSRPPPEAPRACRGGDPRARDWPAALDGLEGLPPGRKARPPGPSWPRPGPPSRLDRASGRRLGPSNGRRSDRPGLPSKSGEPGSTCSGSSIARSRPSAWARIAESAADPEGGPGDPRPGDPRRARRAARRRGPRIAWIAGSPPTPTTSTPEGRPAGPGRRQSPPRRPRPGRPGSPSWPRSSAERPGPRPRPGGPDRGPGRRRRARPGASRSSKPGPRPRGTPGSTGSGGAGTSTTTAGPTRAAEVVRPGAGRAASRLEIALRPGPGVSGPRPGPRTPDPSAEAVARLRERLDPRTLGPRLARRPREARRPPGPARPGRLHPRASAWPIWPNPGGARPDRHSMTRGALPTDH